MLRVKCYDIFWKEKDEKPSVFSYLMTFGAEAAGMRFTSVSFGPAIKGNEGKN